MAFRTCVCSDPFLIAATDWTWPDDTGHIWEALSPHLSCIHKQLKMKASLEETYVEV